MYAEAGLSHTQAQHRLDQALRASPDLSSHGALPAGWRGRADRRDSCCDVCHHLGGPRNWLCAVASGGTCGGGQDLILFCTRFLSARPTEINFAWRPESRTPFNIVNF
eukprot:jgi/Astpho2/38/Aster-07491